MLKFQKLQSREHLEFYLKEFFAIDLEVFKDFDFYASTRDIWLMSKGLFEVAQDFDLEHAGLRIFSSPTPPFKPTHYFATMFGRYAQKNVIELDKDEVHKFYASGVIKPLEGRGYVFIKYQDNIIGVGHFSKGNLVSQFPKKFKMYIKEELL